MSAERRYHILMPTMADRCVTACGNAIEPDENARYCTWKLGKFQSNNTALWEMILLSMPGNISVATAHVCRRCVAAITKGQE